MTLGFVRLAWKVPSTSYKRATARKEKMKMVEAMTYAAGLDRRSYYMWDDAFRAARVMAVVVGVLVIPAYLLIDFASATALTAFVIFFSLAAFVAKKCRIAAAKRHNEGLDRLFASLSKAPAGY
jgi:hypothetical protein